MNIISKRNEIDAFLKKLRTRNAAVDRAIVRSVEDILTNVRRNGDSAVLKYTRRFDDKKAVRLRIGTSEITRAARSADPKVMKAFAISARRIRRFHEMQKERSWSFTEGDTILGQSIRPLKRIGAYIPGGKAAYPSTVLMNVIPAQVAGVKEIALCVPTPDGYLNPYVMAAIEMLGVTEVYRIGGAQAVAALAYGTVSIPKVDKIVGPGNIYVATAKKMVFGIVDIDMVAGPSEILIIADRSAWPSFAAADMLSQAEHDELASAVLITDSRMFAAAVAEEIGVRVKQLKRKEIAKASLENYGAIIVTRNIKDAVTLSNTIAPEHLEIMTRRPIDIVPSIENAGAIFLGPWSPEALGDYSAGPNHTLPTGGTARFSSPLGVYDFCKRSSMLGFTREGFLRLANVVEAIADIEGLEGHGNTIRVRKEKLLKGKHTDHPGRKKK
ncbi:MAG: histidinol dehydrogenase [Nitrospirae bacterium]|nr:histidinol dehydrogenase [Nitrospirota bacterium]